MDILSYILAVLAVLAFLGIVAIEILLLVRLFQTERIGRGLLGLFVPGYLFIWAWRRREKLALTAAVRWWSILGGVFLFAVFAIPVRLVLPAAIRVHEVRSKSQPTPMPRASLPWHDDFSDPASGWQTEKDASAEVGYHEGVMRVLVKANNLSAWAYAGHEFSDYRLTVEATQVAGPDDNEYGVLVRIEDRRHFYRFSISGDGYYRADKYSGEEWELLSSDWTVSDAIHTGAASNLLEVVCQGEMMTFFVNGVQLVQVEDADYRAGDVGLYAGSLFTPGDVEVHFDNLSITEP